MMFLLFTSYPIQYNSFVVDMFNGWNIDGTLIFNMFQFQ